MNNQLQSVVLSETALMSTQKSCILKRYSKHAQVWNVKEKCEHRKVEEWGQLCPITAQSNPANCEYALNFISFHWKHT